MTASTGMTSTFDMTASGGDLAQKAAVVQACLGRMKAALGDAASNPDPDGRYHWRGRRGALRILSWACADVERGHRLHELVLQVLVAQGSGDALGFRQALQLGGSPQFPARAGDGGMVPRAEEVQHPPLLLQWQA